MTDWNFELKLACGRTDGIRFGNWLVCPEHDDPDFVRYVRKMQIAEWVWNFDPPERPWLKHSKREYW